MEHPQTHEAAANPTHSNIDAIAALEHDALGRRTATERVSDAITKIVGNVGFLLAQLALIAGWSAINLHLIPSIKAFDPFPFGVLAIIISTESVFLTIDGQIGTPLREGDTLVCRSSQYSLHLVRPPRMMFFDVLRQKLKWGER